MPQIAPLLRDLAAFSGCGKKVRSGYLDGVPNGVPKLTNEVTLHDLSCASATEKKRGYMMCHSCGELIIRRSLVRVQPPPPDSNDSKQGAYWIAASLASAGSVATSLSLSEILTCTVSVCGSLPIKSRSSLAIALRVSSAALLM